MAEPKTPSRLIVQADSVVKLPRHIKLRHDAGRGIYLILAPERVFEPDDISVEVLKLCDGERSVAAIAQVLSEQFQAPADVILSDIIEMLQDLADKGVVKS